MRTVTSTDGTKIAFETTGQGPVLILVVGAFNDHNTDLQLAQALKDHFTVYNYDQRGHGDSTEDFYG